MSLPLGFTLSLALLLSVVLGLAARTGATPSTDEAAIEAHVRGLFEAYLRQDRDAIRRGHTADWTGFPIAADHLVRGIDGYMEYAERSLKTFRGLGYEIRELEVQVHGDLGIVYYVATWRFRDADGAEKELPLRSVDVYRRESGGWNQCGSNISIVPAPAGD